MCAKRAKIWGGTTNGLMGGQNFIGGFPILFPINWTENKYRIDLFRKYFGSKKIVCQKMFGPKKFCVQKDFWSK